MEILHSFGSIFFIRKSKISSFILKPLFPTNNILFLIQLWIENKKKIASRLILTDNNATFKKIRQEMKLFVKYDNNSFSFRYPYDLKNNRAISQKLIFDKNELYNSVKTVFNPSSKICIPGKRFAVSRPVITGRSYFSI